MKKEYNYTDIQSSKLVADISTDIQGDKNFKQVAKFQRNFMAMVSHELKTPLAILKGYLQYMETTHPSDEEWPVYLKKALEQEERLAGIIKKFIGKEWTSYYHGEEKGDTGSGR